MSASRLELTIARAIVRSHYAMAGGDPLELSDADIDPNSGDLQLAHDVLRSPEMRAIKLALVRLASTSSKVTTWTMLRRAGLPEHVVEWAVDQTALPSTEATATPSTE